MPTPDLRDPRVHAGLGVDFDVDVPDGLVVPCRISVEALTEHFTDPVDDSSGLRAYERHRETIDAKARAVYLEQSAARIFSTDEPLVLKAAMF